MSTRRDNYHQYLKSDWWNEIKKANLKKNCFVCKNTKGLLLHHFSYEKIYKPTIKKASANTITLCYSCHHIVHQIQKDKKLTYEETRGVVRDLRNDWLKACKIDRFYKEQLNERLK